MRMLVAAAALAAIALPAVAEESDTLKHVTTKGVVLEAQGMQIPIAYNADGTFALEVQGNAINGKWRVDGSKLCTSSDFQPEERCVDYPAGKGPGDSFEIQGAMGPAKVTINP
jgi:hypothetical protein